MHGRAIVQIGNLNTPNPPGVPQLSQAAPTQETTAGAASLTANQITSGWLQRSGPAAGYADTFPTADSIIQAMNQPAVGDCFDFWYQNTVAQAMTYTTNTGLVAGTGTLNVAASVTRLYRFTLLATKPQVILVGNNTNASAVLTGFTAAQLASVMPGMGVTGTNVAANSVVLGVTPGDGTSDATTGGRVTLNNNCTGTNSNIAFTFFPRIRVDSLGVLAA